MSTLNFKNAFSQLKADLIGKDSHRGITLTYAWMANQFGHFCLGAIPTFVSYTISKTKSDPKPILYCALIVTLFWFIFEIFNFLAPLAFNFFSKKYAHKKKYTFKPKWGNIAYDTTVDVFFFALGAFSASLFINYSTLNIYILLIIGVALIYPTIDWFFIKMYQSYAEYPFQFRLSQWNNEINENDKEKVIAFLKKENTGNHLLLFGEKLSGKTSLAVGACNELSIKKNACFYLTGTKLYSLLFEESSLEQSQKLRPWHWKDADFLIIDDINPGYPFHEEIVRATDFLRFVDSLKSEPNTKNRNLIKNSNIIWVLGNCGTPPFPAEWIEMLQGLGIPKNKIETICL